jgi:hypothetical protein
MDLGPRLRRTGPRAGTASETFRGKEKKRRACPSSPARALLRLSAPACALAHSPTVVRDACP